MPLQFSWSNGQTLQNISSLDTGTYSVTVTDAHGCTATDVFHIGNDSVFSIDATPDMVTIDLGETVNLNVQPIGSSFGSVLWTPSYALNCSDCISTISSPVESVTYHVTGTDVNGCIAHDTVRINVIPKYVVFVPNVFTPNGDGANDYFEVFGNKEAWKQFNVEVFNRLGEKVYESNDMNFRWDGTFKGVLQNPAVYVYLVKVVYIDNYSEKLFKGSVTLLR
jgi:gliding motility-associated-like protein